MIDGMVDLQSVDSDGITLLVDGQEVFVPYPKGKSKIEFLLPDGNRGEAGRVDMEETNLYNLMLTSGYQIICVWRDPKE